MRISREDEVESRSSVLSGRMAWEAFFIAGSGKNYEVCDANFASLAFRDRHDLADLLLDFGFVLAPRHFGCRRRIEQIQPP